eukprot:s2766_g2.t1
MRAGSMHFATSGLEPPLNPSLGVGVAAPGTHGALGTLHCKTENNSVRRGHEGEAQVPGFGEVPTSGATDHRQEQAKQGRGGWGWLVDL